MIFVINIPESRSKCDFKSFEKNIFNNTREKAQVQKSQRRF